MRAVSVLCLFLKTEKMDKKMEVLIVKMIALAGILFFGIVAIVATKKYENAKEELDKLKGEKK